MVTSVIYEEGEYTLKVYPKKYGQNFQIVYLVSWIYRNCAFVSFESGPFNSPPFKINEWKYLNGSSNQNIGF